MQRSNIVLDMLSSYKNAAMAYVAAKLNIADFLSEGPRSSEELAALMGVNANALRRVMRGLVNRKILFEEKPGYFGLTSAGECLRSNTEDDTHGIALHIGELLYNTWGSLLYSVKTGKPAFEHIHGMKWFEYLKNNPQNAQIFNRGMTNNTLQVAPAFLEAYDFSDISVIADIGGGQGILLSTLLEKYPKLTGILFDSEEVIQEVTARDRCQLVAGSFFETVPEGCDAYMLKSIIHDWSDDEAVQILRNCRKAMHQKSRLLLIEPIMPEQVDEFSLAVELDLGMLLVLNGRERTLLEFKNLYAEAGFELTKVIPFKEPFSIIEGRPC